jgi:CelD/BcsL family acetyltransferase involved in cellulose biosynthesis
MRVECVASEAELDAVLPAWTGLWHRVPNATPFQSPAWLLAWWRHFGTGELRIMAATSGGRLAGVLPLYELREPLCRKLLPLGIGLSDYADALVEPQTGDVASTLLGAIREVAGWEECHLPDLPPDALVAEAIVPSGLVEQRSRTVPCPVMQLPPDPDNLDTVVPKKTLRDVRQAASRSVAAGGATIETADRDRLGEFMQDLFVLHERRWQARGEAGVCADPAVRAFHLDAARGLAAAGMLRLYRLRIAGAVAAVYYGFTWRERAYAYLGGFDPDLPRLSPGAQILRHAIVEAIAEGCRELHFLRGGEAYKYVWGAVDRWNSARTLRRA